MADLETAEPIPDLRKQARERLERKRDFQDASLHLLPGQRRSDRHLGSCDA